MNSLHNQKTTTGVQTPWNRDRLIGPKPPLRPKHQWSIRNQLPLKGRTRHPALFNLAIDCLVIPALFRLFAHWVSMLPVQEPSPFKHLTLPVGLNQLDCR